MASTPLTIYRLKQSIDGVALEDFDDAVESPERLTVYDLPDQFDFSGRIFVSRSDPKRPPWAEFLREGLGDPIDLIEESRSVSAVMIIRVGTGKSVGYFALTFGSAGRFLLRKGSVVPDFGLKVALNTIYDTVPDVHDSGSNRIRSLDSKKVSGDIFNSRIQASQSTRFEAFELDTGGDQLRSITGTPGDSVSWGARITGGLPISLSFAGAFSEIGSLCLRLERAYRKRIYRKNFAWVDNIAAVIDSTLLEHLREKTVELLKSGSDCLTFVPTALLDWRQVAEFRIVGAPGGTLHRNNPEDLMEGLIGQLRDHGKLNELSPARLKQYKLQIVDSEGEVVEVAPLFSSIEGEFRFKGNRFLVSEGDFFIVDRNFLSELDKFIDGLREFTGRLPDAGVGEMEGDYNERAAESSPDYLNLDADTVRLEGRTTPIEICDILTRTKQFIHVKRKLGSSNLSHLFAQGYVSADLFLMNSEFRRATSEKIAEVAEKRSEREDGFKRDFVSFSIDAPEPSDLEIVYAVIAKWKGRSFSEAIPFFSKINLRKAVAELKRMGYRYSLRKIEIDSGSDQNV